MKRIMFVCHGNICRSPMAEFIFKKMLADAGVTDVEAASSATSDEEIINGVGNPVYPPAKRILAEHGIPCDGKRAVMLTKSDYVKYDGFYVMDEGNYRNALRIFGGDEKHKVTKLMDATARGGNVSDPWYTRDFEKAYEDIYAGCAALVQKIVKERENEL